MARTERVELRLEPEVVARMVEARGLASMNAWVRQAVLEKLDELDRQRERDEVGRRRRRGGGAKR